MELVDNLLIAASWTAQPIEPTLRSTLVDRHGNDPTIRFAPANQLFQLCLQPEQFDVVASDDLVVLWRLEDVFERDLLDWADGTPDARQRLLDGSAQLGAAVAGLAASTKIRVIVGDAPLPVGYGIDHLDAALTRRLVDLTTDCSRSFWDSCGVTSVVRLDLLGLQLAAGSAASFDPTSWMMYRQPFSGRFNRRLGIEIAELLIRRTAPAPKVIVLDCDNTLWGGIVGEDGVGNLQCSDAFPGSAYRQFQYAVRRLQRQGVLLVLASKNDDAAVRQAFAQLDGMVLTDDDIATRLVDWTDKATNIAAMADELHLGLDSFVFVDDSRHEIELVRARLPEVRCLQVPDDIEDLPQLLADSGLFRHLAITDDDRQRTQRTRTEAGRTHAAASMSHDDFLASLQLHVVDSLVDESNVARVTQLINKTNQFNVTTIRRTEADVRRLLDDPTYVLRCIDAADRFGDYGLIGVGIGRLDGQAAHIDTLLMSCRVLGRGVETALLALLVDHLRHGGATTVVAEYRPNDKNGLVADLYPNHGLRPTHDQHHFVLGADATIDIPPHISVTSRSPSG